MGAKYGSSARNDHSRKNGEDMVPSGMTPIRCRICGRKLGQAYSTNGIVICDKCGYRFYIRIYGEVALDMPACNLQYEGYYDDADEYMDKVQKRVNGEQILINEPVFEME